MSNPVFRIRCSSSSREHTRVTENSATLEMELNALDALEPSSNRAMD